MKPADEQKIDQAIAAAAAAPATVTINGLIGPDRPFALVLPQGPIAQNEAFGLIQMIMQYADQSQKAKISPIAGPNGAPIIRPVESPQPAAPTTPG